MSATPRSRSINISSSSGKLKAFASSSGLKKLIQQLSTPSLYAASPTNLPMKNTYNTVKVSDINNLLAKCIYIRDLLNQHYLLYLTGMDILKSRNLLPCAYACLQYRFLIHFII